MSTAIVQQFLDGPYAFYDCPECSCSFGAPTTRDQAERQAIEHDAEFHPTPVTTEGDPR